MKRICKIFVCFVWLSFGVWLIGGSLTRWADFVWDYANPLLQKWWNGDEKAYTFNIDQNNKIIDNVKALFYPWDKGGQIWTFISTIAVAIFFALLVWAWFQFIINADDPEGIKKAKTSLLYILLGAAIFFLALRILSTLLDLWSVEGVYGDGWNTVMDKANNLAVFILSFLKALAFFAALFFVVWYWFHILIAVGNEEKTTAAKTGLINVLLALIFIKVIDYLYYVSLSGEFETKGVEFIVQASKFVTYLIGACLVLSLLYAWYMMITATGEDERTTKATNLVKAVFIVWILVLLFMLIIHQVFNDIY